MTTKRHKQMGVGGRKSGVTVRARVDSKFKARLKRYCQRADVCRDESFVLRVAVEEFLDRKEAESAQAPKDSSTKPQAPIEQHPALKREMIK